jgi:hypothetical protein
MDAGFARSFGGEELRSRLRQMAREMGKAASKKLRGKGCDPFPLRGGLDDAFFY